METDVALLLQGWKQILLRGFKTMHKSWHISL